MRRLVGRSAAPDDDGQPPRGLETNPREDSRDEREEKTAEVNADDELFASSHFSIDDGAWDGLEAAYNFHLQLAPGTQSVSCPICLRVTQVPVHQQCGHVLCMACVQQSLAVLGDCPLCQAQHFFKDGNSDLAVTEPRSMGLSYAAATGQDFHLPVSSSSSILATPFQSSIFPLDQMYYSSSTALTAAPSTGSDTSTSRHQDFLSNPSDIPLQLDSLSDLDDVIDLDDLVSSDSERPSPPVAARTSISGSFIAGPIRHPRASTRALTTGGSLASVSLSGQLDTKDPAKTTRSPANRTGKRKARSRKIKRDELAITFLVWETVPTYGTPPEQRYDCGLTIYGSLLIVVGGIVGKLRLNDLHILDLAEKPSSRWTQPPISGTLPPSGNLLQIFVIGDTLYAVGATIDGKFLTELHALNLKSGEWKWEKLEVAGTPPSMRYWYSLTVLHGMAILYGGYGHPQRLSDTFALRFDTKVPTWVELRPRGDIPGPSSTHSVCVIKDRMYIFGGYDGKYRRGQLFSFEIEQVSNERIDCVWRKVETRGQGPAARYTHSGASIGSQLIVYGGNTGCLKGDAYVLDLGTGDVSPTWKLAKCDPPLVPRAWHRAVVYNDAMYVFGGHTAEGGDNSVIRIAFHATAP